MKRFSVENTVFEQLPDYCVGVVVARGLDNHSRSEAVSRKLDQAAADFAQANREANVRELPGVKACRDAFLALGNAFSLTYQLPGGHRLCGQREQCL